MRYSKICFGQNYGVGCRHSIIQSVFLIIETDKTYTIYRQLKNKDDLFKDTHIFGTLVDR